MLRSLIQGRVWFRRHRHDGHLSRTTDSGIFHDVFTSRIGRLPTAQGLRSFANIHPIARRRFITVPFAPVAGLTECFSSRTGPVASGVTCYGVGVIPPASKWPVPGCALTTIRRHQQMTHSTGVHYEPFQAESRRTIWRVHLPPRVCWCGVWDARACRSVGIPLIGIGTGSRATQLSAEGAVCVFPDFVTRICFGSVDEITNAA